MVLNDVSLKGTQHNKKFMTSSKKLQASPLGIHPSSAIKHHKIATSQPQTKNKTRILSCLFRQSPWYLSSNSSSSWLTSNQENPHNSNTPHNAHPWQKP
jgi:hypothetical protein